MKRLLRATLFGLWAAASTAWADPKFYLVDDPSAGIDLVGMADGELKDPHARSIPLEFMDRAVFNEKPKAPNGPKEMTVEYYEGKWSRLPDFSTLKPKKTDRSTSLSTSIRDRSSDYAIRWTGALNITKQGKHKFYIKSSDGSRLIINNKTVVNNDGIHKSLERYAYLDLDVGTVSFELQFFDRDGGSYISAYCRIPSGSKSSLTSYLAPVPEEDKQTNQVVLRNGDVIRGSLQKWEGGVLTLKPAFVGEENVLFEIEDALIHRVWLGSYAEKEARKVSPDEAEEGDTAWIRKDDELRAIKGVCLGIEEDKLKFQFGGAERKVSLERLVGLELDQRRELVVPSDSYHVLILRNGDRVAGTWMDYQDNKVLFKPHYGPPFSVGSEDTGRIELRNGRIQHLVDLEPSDVVQVPWFDRQMAWQRNVSLTGRALRMEGKTYERGLAVHTRCILHFQLPGDFDEFRTLAGFQDGTGTLGRATLRILGDGEVLFEKEDARGDEKPIAIKVPITGVKQLSLVADFGEQEDVGDRIVWANPQVIRTEGLEAIPPVVEKEEPKKEDEKEEAATEAPRSEKPPPPKPVPAVPAPKAAKPTKTDAADPKLSEKAEKQAAVKPTKDRTLINEILGQIGAPQ